MWLWLCYCSCVCAVARGVLPTPGLIVWVCSFGVCLCEFCARRSVSCVDVWMCGCVYVYVWVGLHGTDTILRFPVRIVFEHPSLFHVCACAVALCVCAHRLLLASPGIREALVPGCLAPVHLPGHAVGGQRPGRQHTTGCHGGCEERYVMSTLWGGAHVCSSVGLGLWYASVTYRPCADTRLGAPGNAQGGGVAVASCT